MDIKIPFLGDGIESANVISILVKPGDELELDQTVIELETDKATAPVPAPFTGTVDSIVVKEGDIVKEGMIVVKVNSDDSSSKDTTTNSVPSSTSISAVSTPPSPEPVSPQPTVVTQSVSYEITGDISSVNAAPSIKKFALLSGLDLNRVNGTGSGGRVTWDDVKNYIAFLQVSAFESKETESKQITKPAVPKIDFSKFGPVEHVKLTSLRQKIASHLSNAWDEIPHVTQFADINIDHIMKVRKGYNAKLKNDQVKLTVTIFILRAIVETLKSFPNFNSSLVGDELIVKQYYHLGVAVDTDAGLVVPVIRDIDKKTLNDIAIELDELAEKARSKSLAVDDIQGATFTLSNLGGLGASHFTPIVNSPEVAILGTGRANFVPRYDEKSKELTNHLIMPVALSYDHRVIDGADGARFVQELIKNIENFDKKWVK